MVARERGDTKRATELLHEAIALQKRSLDEWPTNPVAVDSLFSHLWHLGETGIRAGQHEATAKAVETLVWACSDQLRAFHYGAEQLLECAELAEADRGLAVQGHVALRGGDGRPEFAKENVPVPLPENAAANAYRRRARELVALAHETTNRTPDTTERFAWFLLTCQDESLRDPTRALELAMTVVREVPKRGDPWLTLALAHYRLNDWLAADDAVQKAIKLPHLIAETSVCDWLLLAMIRHQQGRSDEARQWHKKARDQLANDNTDVEVALRLAAEADAILKSPRIEETYPNIGQPTSTQPED
jgi:tetratricopeptide (TPR) repeat protein